MDAVTNYKIAFIITVISLSWGASSYYAFNAIDALEHQKRSVRYLRNFFFVFGLAFVFFALSTVVKNIVTLAPINISYILSFYYLKLTYFSRVDYNEVIKRRHLQVLALNLIIVVMLNSGLFYLVWDAPFLRAMTLMSSAMFYCITTYPALKGIGSYTGERASRISLTIIVILMISILITLAIAGNSDLYFGILLTSQCLVVFVLFGSSLVSFLNETVNRYQQESITDFLTGLYNRRHFYNRFKEIINTSQRQLAPISLMIIDIDHFKNVNDTLGHDAGDEALVSVSNIIKDSIRLADIASRHGGEEFCILLPHTNVAGALLLADRIRQRIEGAEIKFGKQTFSLTASIGIAEVDINKSPDESLVNADKALYQSKANGRNQVTLYSEAIQLVEPEM